MLPDNLVPSPYRWLLIAREGGRCFICGGTIKTTGHPLEAHHHPVARSLANMIDWALFPLWIAQKYGRDDYQFSDVEVIHHA